MKPDRLKRHRHSGFIGGTYQYKEALDRISSLPDALLVLILSLLQTKDAVKSGTLSKRWQYLWTSVPVLDFFPVHPQTVASIEKLSDIVSRIDNILVLHESIKITKFNFICVYDHVDGYSSNVICWLRFATRTNVEILKFSLPPIRSSGVHYVLPQHFYDNSSINQMRFGYCQMVPHQPINWPSLTVLQLYCVQLSDSLIRGISSGCPSIKILKLYSRSGFRRLEINSKSLIRLVINGYLDSNSGSMDGSALEILAPNIPLLDILGKFKKKIRVIDLSSLVDVKLDCSMSTNAADVIQDYPNMLNELLLSLKHVKNLTMGSWCTQEVGLDDEFLSLYTFERENYWTSTGMLTCLMKSVKIIKIVGFGGERLEFELVQYLLENARVLQKMVILTNKANHGSWRKISEPIELLTVVASLLTFPRSSSNAIILFS